MRSVRTAPVVGLIAEVALLAALAASVGLSWPGWALGLGCGVVTNAALAHRLGRPGEHVLGPADRVTLLRATLAGGVAALVADSFGDPASAPVALLVALTAVALVLDAVDGYVARRTGTVSRFGARFDMEVDAFLILVLSGYVAQTAGWWVLAIGAARYVFAAAGWLLPWLRAPLPPRYWCKVVAAVQGIVLTVAMADILPRLLTDLALVGALALLTESFGREVWQLRQLRGGAADRAGGQSASQDTVRDRPRGRVRGVLAGVTTVLAAALVWAALVAPDQTSKLTPAAFVRLPVEGLVLVALALVLPSRAGRVVAALAGLLLGLLAIAKIIDMGFFETLDRPFNPVTDRSYFGPAIGVLSDSIGERKTTVVVGGVLLLFAALLLLLPLSLVRLRRVVARHRTSVAPAAMTLGVVWVLCAAFGVQIVGGAPVASTSAAGLAYDEVGAVRDGIEDHGTFAREIAHDPVASTPGYSLLTGLRGKDVIFAFVESYGRVAVQGSTFSPKVDAVLESGTAELRSAGFGSRSAFLTSPTFGGISWLAHSTLQSGLWVDNQQRYDQLVASNRYTLSDAFKRAGWRTVSDVPSNRGSWPEGSSFYHYDKLYNEHNVGYRGPKFSYAKMPDQYVLSAFQRRELAKKSHPPVMAEIDLVSSHTPWAPLPHMVAWNKVGDGSVYAGMPAEGQSPDVVWRDANRVRAGYGRSIEYTLRSLISYVHRFPDPNLVLVVLGDHQPATIVTGQDATHDVPISIIAHDPAVLSRISGWGWQGGLLPHPQAPVWPMDSFRNRFLSAFGPRPGAVP